MQACRCRTFCLLVCSVIARRAAAQEPLPPENLPAVNQLFDSEHSVNSLKCTTRRRPATLDFSFRFHTGFIAKCRLEDPKEGSDLTVFLRITPRGSPAAVLGYTVHVPEIAPEARTKMPAGKLKRAEFLFSGGFALGEGHYSVEFLIVKADGARSFHPWEIQAARQHDEHELTLALAPNCVAPILSLPWNGELAPDGLRLTVLLHTAPVSPRESKLYVWDQPFLLESLISLLRRVPCKSIRLVAFSALTNNG